MSGGSTPRPAFTSAAAPLIDASAPIISRDSGSPEIWKFCTARWVCAPHRASAGTATSPIESCSMRAPGWAPAPGVTSVISPSARSRADRQQRSLRGGPVGEEVVALVVYHDEGREIANLDPPHRFHAELRVLQDLDLGDALLGQLGCGAADRAEIKAAVCLA